MNWFSLASVLLGAGIGVGSTLLADRLRWHRESIDRQQSYKREAYTEYLTALARWRNGLRETAYDPNLSNDERREKARQALLNSQAYEKRMEMFITAPPSVITNSEATYKALRNMKDPIARGVLQDSSEYRDLVAAFESRLQQLRTSMRADLGVANPEAGIGFPGIMP